MKFAEDIVGDRMFKTKIVSVATVLGPVQTKMSDVLAQVAKASLPAKMPVGYVQRLTGVETVYRRTEDQNTSDFAAMAGKKALQKANLKISDIDLLIFASASQDLMEPATSHIVSALLGADGVPVMDVKNACNSLLNGMQVANALIKIGQYKTVLIVSGETPSMAIRWACSDRDQFMRSFAGFTMSDAGAGVLLSAAEDDTEGVIAIEFRSDSTRWDVGTLSMGGSRSPRDIETTYFDMDGRKLADAFMSLGPGILNETLAANGYSWNDFKAIGMHQVAAPYIDDICKVLDVPANKVIKTIADYGNLTSATMAMQIELAMANGSLSKGDLFAYIGLAGGISTGLGIFRL
jgi:3-oxoacyl-[acyl-carrier-protein] synthase-3